MPDSRTAYAVNTQIPGFYGGLHCWNQKDQTLLEDHAKYRIHATVTMKEYAPSTGKKKDYRVKWFHVSVYWYDDTNESREIGWYWEYAPLDDKYKCDGYRYEFGHSKTLHSNNLVLGKVGEVATSLKATFGSKDIGMPQSNIRFFKYK
jgi:hypothetical protein